MLDKNYVRARLAFVRQGSEVERFHTKRMIQRNDVGHHSFHVAWLAYFLATHTLRTVQSMNRIVMAALAHDLAEHITGDMPGDFKREMGIREMFGDYERDRFVAVGLNFEDALSLEEKRCVKLADMLEGAFLCISEASLGNGRVGLVFRNFRKYIEAFAPFNEMEAAIIEYIDELWNHYGVSDAPGWNKTAHSVESLENEDIMGIDEVEPVQEESVTYRSPLLDALRVEEAEGRATPRPQSNAPMQGDMPVPEGPSDDTSDDRASPDLAPQAHLPANARQHGGSHYKDVGYEHWDLVLDVGMNYFQGCATKYVTRARKHEAGCRLNILKAIHYIDKLQEAELAGRVRRDGIYSVDNLVRFGVANQLNDAEVQIIKDVTAWRLDQARAGLQALLETCPPDEQSE